MDAQVVLDVGHAGHALREVLGAAARGAAVDRAAQRDLAAADADLDLRGVDVGVVVEPVADVLLDPLVRALVPLGPAAAVVLLPALLGVAVAGPRRGLVRGARVRAAFFGGVAAVTLAAVAARGVAATREAEAAQAGVPDPEAGAPAAVVLASPVAEAAPVAARPFVKWRQPVAAVPDAAPSPDAVAATGAPVLSGSSGFS
jgi:hypothetical protein